MDATRDDQAPATQTLVVMCEGNAWRLREVGQLNRDPKDIEAEAKRWDWLASHLTDLIADAARWKWFREYLSVEDDGMRGEQYLFFHDTRIEDATVLPGYENTIESLVDARIAADAHLTGQKTAEAC